MDFRLTAEEQAFEKEVHEFFVREVTPELAAEIASGLGLTPPLKEFVRKLGSRGWLVPTLPREWGGLGTSFMCKYLIAEEFSYYFPEAGSITGPHTVCPVIWAEGTEDQKRRFIPKIARGELDCALGYTEPEAGTDLANLSTRAVEDGDYYVINGQKIYSTAAHFAEYHWLAARTNPAAPKHKGISLFMVPLNSPGITIQPLWALGPDRTNVVFYDNVRVHRENLIGGKDNGWYVMATALAHERAFPTGAPRRAFDELLKYVRETTRNGKPLGRDPLVRQKVAEMAVQVEVVKGLSYRVAAMLSRDTVPVYEASMLKVFLTELEVKIPDVATRIMGMAGQLTPADKRSPLGGSLERLFLAKCRRSFTGGANEIQRNIIAQRGFGMPREGGK